MFEDQKQTPAPPPTGGALSYPSTSLAAMLEVPKGAARPASSTLTVHIMPKEYYGVAPKTSVKKPAALPAPKPVLPPPPPKLEKPLVPSTQIKKRRIPIVAIIGVLFVAVIALGGYLFLRSIRQPAPQPVAETPQPRSAPKPEPLPSQPSPTPAPEPIRPGIDTDSDGLTDVEERVIYGSDSRNSDSDGDSFIDGNEVLHLYDPTKSTSARFDVDTVMQHYQVYGLGSVLAPKNWVVGSEILGFTILLNGENRGEMIEVRENDHGGKDIGAYVAERHLGVNFVPFTAKNGLIGLRSTDQRLIVLELPTKFLVFTYTLGTARTIDFLRTFEFVVNSFELSSGE